MKVLVVIVAVVFLIFVLIIGSFVYKFFRMTFKQIENSNAKRIEMSKEYERMKREVKDRQNRLR